MPADVVVSRCQVWCQGNPWKLIGEVAATQTSYTDSTAEPDRAYLYMVRALDAQGIPVSSETLAAAPQTGSQGGGGGSGGSTRPRRRRGRLHLRHTLAQELVYAPNGGGRLRTALGLHRHSVPPTA